VSLLPVIVPFQHKILSSSGNADIPESPLICQKSHTRKQIIEWITFIPNDKTDYWYWMNHFFPYDKTDYWKNHFFPNDKTDYW
jgi:hypothetical protein